MGWLVNIPPVGGHLGGGGDWVVVANANPSPPDDLVRPQDEAMDNEITVYDVVERGAGIRIRRKFGCVGGMPGGLNLADMCTDNRRVAILQAGAAAEKQGGSGHVAMRRH